MIEVEARDTEAAMKACGDALVGKGEVHVELTFPETGRIIIQSQALIFNGGERGGKARLLIRTFIPIPAPTAVVDTVTVQRKGTGLQTISKIPVTAGGHGSLLDFSFDIGRVYAYKGKKVGYFEARCPDGVFKVDVPKLLFKNEAHTPGVPATTVLKGGFAIPCTPKG